MPNATRGGPLAATFILTLAAWRETQAPDPTADPTCPVIAADQQPLARFPAGRTLHLPGPAAAPGCANRQWVLSTAPAGNTNVVVETDAAAARFVPIAPGEYVFSFGSETTWTVTVVTAVPFEHFNYYPAQSLAKVGDEVWVAAAFSPEIIRLDAAGSEVGRIKTGPWPVAIAAAGQLAAAGSGVTDGVAVVAQRADDTLGFIDVRSGTLSDAVWVGDEPANVLVSADGATAFVALATEAAVAVVDVATRRVERRITVGPDPLAMVMSPDTGHLFVATHRSATTARAPFDDDARGDDQDITVIDVAARAVVGTIGAVGSTIDAMTVSGGKLFVATTVSNPAADLTDLTADAFSHQVRVFDANTLAPLVSADLSRQATSTGFAVSLHGLAVIGDAVWVVAESSNAAIRLDAETLEERARVTIDGRPRAVLADDDALWVHGAQSYSVARIEADVARERSYPGDPRSPELALGQRYFTGAGEGYGVNHSCNNCHLDGLMDGNVWKAGPFQLWAAARPFFWLQGTAPLGWEGYLSSGDNFVITAGSTIGKNPDQDEAPGLSAYLNGLVPPPPANGWTARDGAMTEAARRGEAVFSAAGCANCHVGEIKTSNQVVESGASVDVVTDIPSLIGSYRFGYWLQSGAARTMEEAVARMVDWTGATGVTGESQADLTRYLNELTAREFFVLRTTPSQSATSVAADAAIEVVLSHPVFDDEANLRNVALVDAAGAEVPARRAANGRVITLTPSTPLTFGERYGVRVAAGLEAFDTRALSSAVDARFTVADAPTIVLDGDYQWVVDFPAFDFANQRLDPVRTLEAIANFSASPTATGAILSVPMHDSLTIDVPVAISGAALAWPSVPLPLGGTSFANTWPNTLTLVDDDGDNIADSASGDLRISGPGFDREDVTYRLVRAPDPTVCEPGETGTHPLTIDRAGPTVSWPAGLRALSVYVTSPSATLPLGPGTVSGGQTYWSALATNFPTGFDGPVTYGTPPTDAADNSEPNGAPAGGAALVAGACLKISVQFNDFSTSSVTLTW